MTQHLSEASTNGQKPTPPRFLPHVFGKELGYLKKRWAAAYMGRAIPRTPGDDMSIPTTKHGLVGLAFSGGGIRSATFNLGVVQALHRRGLFKHVDYVSTVSGGGYLGSSISTIMRKPKEHEDDDTFPFKHEEKPDESEYLQWIRNNSNYLVEGGFIDYVRLFALLLRGIVINLLILIPILLLVSLLLSLYYGGAEADGILGQITKKGLLTHWGSEGFDAGEAFKLTPIVAVVVGIWYFLYPVILRAFRIVKHEEAAETGSDSSVKSRNKYERSFAWALVILGIVVAVELMPILIYQFHALREAGGITDLGAGVLGGSSAAVLIAADKLMRKLGTLGQKILISLIGLVASLLPMLVILYTTMFLVYKGDSTILGFSLFSFFLIVVVGVWIFCWAAVDINTTALLGFYRDRLASAYLVGKDVDRKMVDIEEDLNLQGICQDGSTSPYHLLNVALNLQGSKDPRLRERKSDFFIFSKHYYGGGRTGYATTDDLEKVFPQMDLATAMAISAAAASPNSGSFTYGSLVALMTLLNIRLGFWVPNPSWLNDPQGLSKWIKERQNAAPDSKMWGLASRFSWRIRPWAWLQEMRSLLNDQQRWINVSDGGHIENLGVIELLRRRCKFIIAGDGEADAAMKFGGLAKLMRYARIDLGIEIEIHLDDVRLHDGLSRKHCAFGRIWYPPLTEQDDPEEGYLLYVKSSVTGDEDQIITEYRTVKEDFPHESTADQFFDEGQFEAYRSLGYHAVEGLFEKVNPGEPVDQVAYDELETWFKDLEMTLAPEQEEIESVG